MYAINRSANFVALGLIVLLLATLALSACGARQNSNLQGRTAVVQLGPQDSARYTPAAAHATQPVSGLPAPAGIAGALAALRSGSFDVPDAFRLGREYSTLQHFNLVSQNGDEAQFSPAFAPGSALGDAAYAIYPFNLPSAAGQSTVLTLSWSQAPANADLFIGLTNWDSNSWDWFNDPLGLPISFNDLAAYTNAQDDLAVAVVLLGSAPASLSRLEFYVTELPVADLTAAPTTVILGGQVSFDASGSADPDGTIQNYEWDFDADGSFNEAGTDEETALGNATPTATFNTVGDFASTVRVSDNRLGTATASTLIHVLPTPEVILTATPELGNKPLQVDFTTDTSTILDPITSYEWDLDGDSIFGEAGPEALAAGQSFAQYTYDAVEVVTATVKVTTETATVYSDSVVITVGNTPPVADLTATPEAGNKPLDVTFDATGSSDPGGSLVDFEWDFDDDTIYSEAGSEADAHGFSTVMVQYTVPGSYLARVRVTDDDGATASASAGVTVTNSPPVADLTADVTDGDSPLEVLFDASGSSDPGGAVANYRWDFDSDGLFNNSAEEQAAEGDATPALFSYDNAGYYTAAVEVTDDNGAIDTATLLITVHGWAINTLDDHPSATDASGATLAVVANVPVVAYYAEGVGIRFARSVTATGSLLTDWTVASAPAASGDQLSLAAVFGKPALAYVKGGGQLVYRRSSGDGLLSGDWSAEMPIESGASQPTLLQINGAPAVYFRSSARGTVSYVRADSQTGVSAGDWDTVIDVIVPTGTGSDARDPWALALVNGKPAGVYSYYNGPADEEALTYSRSSNTLGDGIDDVDGWDINEDVAPAAAGDQSWSIFGLDIVGGKPAVIVKDPYNEACVYFQAADNADGTGWTAPVAQLFGLGGMDAVGSFKVVGGFPAFAYQGALSADISFVMSSTADGAASADWAGTELIENGTYDSIRLVDVAGKPGVVYIDTANRALKYAVKL